MSPRSYDFRAESLGAVPYRWVVLQFEFSGPFLVLYYEDSVGYREKHVWQWTPAAIASQDDSPWGTTVQAHLTRLAIGLPDNRSGPHATGPVPIAVFFSPPFGLEGEDYEFRLWDRLAALYESQTLIARMHDRRPLRRSPLRLPLRVIATDLDAQLALGKVAETWWCTEPTIREFGLQIETATEQLEAKLLELPRQIVVTSSLDAVSSVSSGLREASRPRLIVFLDPNYLQPASIDVPRGTALLRLPPPSYGVTVQNFVRSFILGLIHDLPIHEAVKGAVRMENPLFIPRLTADPISNQSLRLSEALLQLKRETERLSMRVPSVATGPFLERLALSNDPEARHLSDQVAAAFEATIPQKEPESPGWAPGALQQLATELRILPAQIKAFEQESLGLLPMAQMVNLLEKAQPTAVAATDVGIHLAQDPETALLLRKYQERFVDVAMSRLETEPLFVPLVTSDVLAVSTRYEVRVHIGNPQAESLVTGPRRSIDPLLPDTPESRGHELEVSIQGKDFTVLSASTQKLWLPEVGGTEPAYFEVRTPNSAQSKANLRICVYYRNHLVQSYLMTALVNTSETGNLAPGQCGVEVQLEFSRTERFTNLQELKPRLLSVGANQASGSTTHEMIVKGDGVSSELTLFASTFDTEAKKFRATLEAAAKDPSNPNVPRTYPAVSAGQQPAPDVAGTFRSLARQGSELFDALFRKVAVASQDLRDSLVRVKESADEKLQVVCFDDNFVFPWSLLYDFPVPESRKGVPDPTVCLGFAVDASGNAVTCPHTCKDRVFCVRGFWGVRHYVEELYGRGVLLNPTVSRVAQDPVRLIYDANLPQAATLLNNLQSKLGASNITVGPIDPDALVNLLWQDPPLRPSILIVLGHLDTEAPTAVGEPEGERIVLVPQSKWLTRKMISERNAKKWLQPHSIVLLMVCESAITGVEKVNSFLSAWDTAGAGAIVGTECIVGSQLAADFAEHLAVAMWKNNLSLGESTTSFRRKLTSAGNPLAFLFRAVGDIDLVVQ